jgi:Anti sigma-E protein RseA, N-terminal domain
MTGLHETSASRDANSREFHREQLSAMMDGALSADEARFLLRRMEHDDELADCWERWQFAGDAMRGIAGRALPADFSRRVGRAIADDVALADAIEAQTLAVAAAPGTRRPLLRWGGGAALAASVALAALIGSRTLSAPDHAPQQVATAPSAPVAVPVASVRVPEPVLPAGVAEAGAAAIAAAATKDNRAVRPHLVASAQAVPVGRSAAADLAAAKSRKAMSSQAVQVASATYGRDLAPGAHITSKPWPRALVPGASAGGEVTAGLEGSPAFQPFQPPRSEWLPPNAASSAEAAAPSH